MLTKKTYKKKLNGKLKLQNKHIRKGDKVIVLSGNDRMRVGTVLSRTVDRVIVQGVNVRKKHVKKNQLNPTGGIVQHEAPIHISKIAHCVDEENPKKIKVGVDSSGSRQLVYKEDNAEVPYRSVRTK